MPELLDGRRIAPERSACSSARFIAKRRGVRRRNTPVVVYCFGEKGDIGGFGSHLVQAIVRHHGGSFKRTIGRRYGSTFTVGIGTGTLPVWNGM